MEDEKKRKGSIVAGEEVVLNEEENKIELSDTIEVSTIKNDEATISSQEDTEKDIKDENKQEIKEDKKEVKKNKDGKRKINKKLLAVILVGIACVVLTIVLIVIKINSLNEKYKLDEPTNVFESKDKKDDEDKKYVLGEDDTLDFNDIETKKFYIIDGTEYDNNDNNRAYEAIQSGKKVQEIIKINGLKNKEIENNINSNINQKIMEFSQDNYDYVSCNVKGNFNDILSIEYGASAGTRNIIKGYNIDLNTGNEIPFEDIFTKSAPIASLISNNFFKKLAWDFEVDVDYDVVGEEKYFERRAYFSNMNNRDTSDYEDKGLEIANWYKENKGNINYSITPMLVTIYDVETKEDRYNVTIPLYENNYCVAIYKRFKSNNSIYEKDVNCSGFVPYSMPMSYYSGCKVDKDIEHGKVLKNLYLDMSIASYTSINNEKIESMSKTLVQNLIQEEKNKAMSNPSKYYVLQGTLQFLDWTDFTDYYNSEIDGYFIPHYRAFISYGECELDNFDNLNKDLAEAAIFPSASSDPFTLKLYYYIKSNYKDDNPYGNKMYYFDKDGNYLGDDIIVVKDMSRNEYNPS